MGTIAIPADDIQNSIFFSRHMTLAGISAFVGALALDKIAIRAMGTTIFWCEPKNASCCARV